MTTRLQPFHAVHTSVATDEFTLAFDPRGILTVEALGFWPVGAVERYFAAIEPLLRDGRRRFGRAMVLVDKRRTPVQSTEVAERLTAGCIACYQPTDRLAVVVATSLMKLQAKRVLPPDRASSFLSIAAAEHYLLAS